MKFTVIGVFFDIIKFSDAASNSLQTCFVPLCAINRKKLIVFVEYNNIPIWCRSNYRAFAIHAADAHMFIAQVNCEFAKLVVMLPEN